MKAQSPSSPVVQDLSDKFRIATTAPTQLQAVAALEGLVRQVPSGMAGNAAWEGFKLAVMGLIQLMG